MTKISQAQFCTTDCITNINCTAPESGGYCPSSIPDAVFNEYYDLNLTVIAPASGDLGNGTNIAVNYIDIVAIENLPEGIIWCKSTDQFKHNEPKCIHLWGIPSKVGDYQLEIKVKATVLGGLLSVDRTDNSLVMHVIKSRNPEVSFYADTQFNIIGSPIHFFDNTDSSATSWLWEFEGGTPATSDLQNPIIAWHNSGTYSVSLTAYNSYGNKRLVKYNYIHIADSAGQCPPIADYCADKRKVIVKEPVLLSTICNNKLTEWINTDDNSVHQQYGYTPEEMPISWQWFFEKGTPQESNNPNPIVYWTAPGQYAVNLKVIGSSGSDELYIERYIFVEDVSEFTFFPNPCYNILTVEAPDMKQITIYDMVGKCVLKTETYPTHQEIDIRGLKRGVYIVRVQYQTGKVEGKKLIVI